MTFMTFRFTITRPSLEALGITDKDSKEPPFPGLNGFNQVLFVMTCLQESHESGHSQMTVVSTTMLPIQKHDVRWLRTVGVHEVDLKPDTVIGEIVKAHDASDKERMETAPSRISFGYAEPAFVEKQRRLNLYHNGVGDRRIKWILTDPELLELEKLYGDEGLDADDEGK